MAQTITIALSCLRIVDEDHMAHLLRYLLLSSAPKNVKRIISQIRLQVKFISIPETHLSRNKKLKGKSFGKSAEASILESICSNIRFKSVCFYILQFSFAKQLHFISAFSVDNDSHLFGFCHLRKLIIKSLSYLVEL